MKKNNIKRDKKREKLINRGVLIFFILIFIILLLISIIINFKNQIGNYIKLTGKNILENDYCGDWNECYFTYSLDDSDNIILDGEQKRTCLVNGIEKTETKKCFSKESITAKKTDNYIEVYDSQGNLISKLEIVKDDEYKKLNIEIFNP